VTSASLLPSLCSVATTTDFLSSPLHFPHPVAKSMGSLLSALPSPHPATIRFPFWVIKSMISVDPPPFPCIRNLCPHRHPKATALTIYRCNLLLISRARILFYLSAGLSTTPTRSHQFSFSFLPSSNHPPSQRFLCFIEHKPSFPFPIAHDHLHHSAKNPSL
jgi:hypothetical protein